MMAFYVGLIKISENEVSVQYQFETDKNNTGIIEIRKSDGNVKEIQAAPADSEGLIFERAAWAAIRHWRQGEFPDKTCWAS